MPTYSLHAATRLYLDALRESGASPSTQRQYGATLTRLCARLPTRQFAGVTTADLANAMYGTGGLMVGMGAGTVRTYRAAIRGLFRYGHMSGWRRDMIAIPESVIRQRGRRPTTTPTRLTADELLLMLDRAQHPILRGMLAVAMNTALRVSDVRTIQIHDIGFATGDLGVIMQKTGLLDALPITLDLDRELRVYLTWYTAETGVTVHDGDAYLFPGFDSVTAAPLPGFVRVLTPTRPVGYDWARTRLHELFRACGVKVEKREAWHTIRRSVARIYFDSLRDRGFDHALLQTASLLGHKHAQMTEDYLGLDAERAARDESLRGKRLIIPSQNVSPLRRLG